MTKISGWLVDWFIYYAKETQISKAYVKPKARNKRRLDTAVEAEKPCRNKDDTILTN